MTTETQNAGAGNNEAGVQSNAEGEKPQGEGATSNLTEGTKPEGEQGGGKGSEGEKPAEVDYSFEMPEGIELDAASADEFKAIAKDLKLSAEDAKRVVDLAIKREQARVEAFQNQVKTWAEEVKADKELGGDKLAENLAVAKKAVDLGPPELKELLDTTGLGSHPVVVRWAFAIGKALSEDRLIPANRTASPGPALTDEDRANRLYGNT